MHNTKTLRLNDSGDAVIALGAAVSNILDVRGFNHLWIKMPAAWTPANIAIHAASEEADTFVLLRDETSAAVYFDNLAAGVSYIGLSMIIGLRYIKLASVQVADPTTGVNQAVERTIEFALES